MAQALQDGGARFALHNAMQNSNAAEGKVFLASYLLSSGLGDVLRNRGVDSREILHAFPLEMYLPVPDHRQKWVDSDSLLVVVQLSEDDPIIAYDLGGRAVRLSHDRAPSRPVLAIVPAEAFDSRGGIRPRSRRWALQRDEITTLDHCTPEMIICDHDPTGGGWVAPAGAVSTRGVGVREFISHMRTTNDHEPWLLGAPEFTIYIVGTSNTDPNAELQNVIHIPESLWAGSDDGANAQWRLKTGGYMALADWDIIYGTHVQVKCMEDDWDLPGTITIPVNGTTQIGGVSVPFQVQIPVNESSDDCGQYAQAIRLSTGAWTQIYSIYSTISNLFSGTSDLHWVGFGLQL